MCGKHSILFATIALLVCASTAPAPDHTRIIDDFEYMFPPEPGWIDTSPGPSTATLTVGDDDAPQGNCYGHLDYSVAGGWEQPADPTDYESWDSAGLRKDFAPLDFGPGGQIRMTMRANYGWDIMKMDFFTVDYGGDALSQTLFLGASTAEYAHWWLDPSQVAAIIAPDDWVPPWDPPPIVDPRWWSVPVIRPMSGWKEIVINDYCYVPWGDALVDFDAMESMSLMLWPGWNDTSGASGGPKLEGADILWPTGPLTGLMDVDNIYYVSEPATIALLGLGGLALIRKMRNKQ